MFQLFSATTTYRHLLVKLNLRFTCVTPETYIHNIKTGNNVRLPTKNAKTGIAGAP